MRHLAALLRPFLLLLLIFSAQFQVGLMPAQGADGQMVMVICSGDGPMMMVLDPVSGEFHPAPAQTRKSGCNWAGCCCVAMPEMAQMPQPVPRLLGLSPQTAVELWRPAHDPRGIWARGPPLSV